MKEFIQELISNVWLQFFIYLISPISIILAIFFYKKSKKEKKFVFLKRNINLVENSLSKINGLRILYNDLELRNVSILKLAFWNPVNEVIRCSDISNQDPISIMAKEDNKILDIKIVYETNSITKTNNIQIKTIEDKKKYVITFDYLSMNDGAVIQILHTGKNIDDVLLTGTIIGIKEFKNKPSKNRLLLNRIFGSDLSNSRDLGLGYIVLSFIFPIILLLINKEAKIYIVLILYFLPTFILGIIFMRRMVPKGFDSFYDDIN